MKTLFLGGSFNPIHHGHLICSRAVMERAGYQRLILVPSAHPPHKPHHVDLAGPEHRLRMCQLAAASCATFDVDDLELMRTTPSYTLETARQLKARGCDEVHWLIGADMLNFLPQWHRPLELLQEVHFVVMGRAGVAIDWDRLPAEFQPLRGRVVEAPQIQISSTDIRRRVRGGLPIDFLVPPPVLEYIRAQRLYL